MHLRLTLAAALLLTLPARAAEYQWSTTLPDAPATTALWGRSPFFLYIPPSLPHVRAVLMAPANIIERRLADDPSFRAEAAHDGFAILFFQNGLRKGVLETPDTVRYIQTALDQLAAKSGYPEIATVPWIPLGHSGNSQFVQSVLRHATARTLAAVVIKGGVPAVDTKTKSTAGLLGVPVLGFTGEFEEVMPPGKVRNGWWPVTVQRIAEDRAAAPEAEIAAMEDRDHGHVGWEQVMTDYLNFFLHKAFTLRLNPDGTLHTVPYASGWLGDPAENFPSAPVAQYQGDPAAAFWFFDRESAEVWEKAFRRDEHKQDQMIAMTQDGQIAPWWNGWALQAYNFEPLPDGESFTASATTRDAVPPPFSDAGRPLGHVPDPHIQFSVVGWASQMLQTGPNTFRVAFDREGVNGRTVHMLIGALLPGDATYKDATAVATLDVPYNNTAGTPQHIDVPRIKDIVLPKDTPASTVAIPLPAKVDTHRRVDYYVSYGPALIENGNTLRLTDIPVHANFPIEVSVTAYQWGTAAGVRFQSAQPVTQTFLIKPPRRSK
jgi:hypothetical protein